MKSMHCPTCEPKTILMQLERERYGGGTLTQTWECHLCGTQATTSIPCEITTTDCEGAASGVRSAPHSEVPQV